MSTTSLTVEQAAEAQTIRDIRAAARDRLNTARDRGLTAADLAAYDDASREARYREQAMRARWWPSSVTISVCQLSDDAQVIVWPTTDPSDGYVLA
ncbi:hypothetical protein MYK68_04870 [Gordonia sp. PP30]|uniref:hypothetical protein n=1 Tax=Gordonia sp. PP30 TaxID=2935861 RepID=UPI001FFE455C|nr:hypothetical protein [Gordonia sp. PP30]UQE75935.1 hypothetical protein MYK68_04870 [Gordonia sp. PP30]